MARRVVHSMHMSEFHKIKNQNYVATKQIDKLLKDMKSKHIGNDKKEMILQQTFNIYDSLNNMQDHVLINKLLNVCYNEIDSSLVSDKFMEISNRIINVNNISLTTTIKCCKQLHVKQRYPSHLIVNIIDNIFETAFKNKKLNDEYDIKCLCSLMDFYGYLGNVDKAKSILHKMANLNKLDVAMVGSMMKCLINNNQNDDAIELYEQYHKTLCDNVIKVFYIKACANTDKPLIDTIMILI